MTALFLHLSLGEKSDRVSDPGEGTRFIDRPYPLTPTLSPWERGSTGTGVIGFSLKGDPDRALTWEARR